MLRTPTYFIKLGNPATIFISPNMQLPLIKRICLNDTFYQKQLVMEQTVLWACVRVSNTSMSTRCQ